jgi:ATP-dependent DNA helicase PIF1
MLNVRVLVGRSESALMRDGTIDPYIFKTVIRRRMSLKRIAPERLGPDTQSDAKRRRSSFVEKKDASVGPDGASSSLDDPEERRMAAVTAGLSPSQRIVFDRVQTGVSLFFTGEAGTGKSFLLEAIVRSARMMNDGERIFVTASTGVSACAIGGTTLHSFAGVGLGEDPVEVLIAKLTNATIGGRHVPHLCKAAARWRTARLLVIDECSMIDPGFFGKLDLIARALRRSPNVPFGGMQVVMAGDFFQLPPVASRMRVSIGGGSPTAVAAHRPSEPTMIFETDAWRTLIGDEVHVLKEAHRQTDDAPFLSLLRGLRYGCLTDSDTALMAERMKASIDAKSVGGSGIPKDTIKLYPTRKEAEDVNEYELTSLPGEERVFDAKDSGDAFCISANRDSWMAPQRVVLKEGALVMFIKNIDVERGVCNGTSGCVVDFATPMGLPRVRISDGTLVTATRQTWEIRQGDWLMASRTQIPLVLAYAITIHKSQGMTLKRVEASVGRLFEKSQLYVALSRCSSSDGLYITGKIPDRSMLEPHPLVSAWWSKIVDGGAPPPLHFDEAIGDDPKRHV